MGLSGFLVALSFLTRLPVAGRRPVEGIDKAPPWFPTVGALVGLLVAGVYALAYPYMPSLLAGLIAVVAGILITGGFHEDGLADSCDAIGSGATGRRALEILRDSRLGTYGTIALIVALTGKVVAVGSLQPATALAALVMAHTLGRGGAVVLMSLTPAARADGLGSSGVAEVTGAGSWFAAVSAMALSGLAAGWWVVPSAVLVALVVIWLRRTSAARFGGVTGDLLGACEQVGELVVLGVVAVLVWNGSHLWWDGVTR